MTSPYTGMPIAHPHRRLVATFTGHMEAQSEDVAQMMIMLRTGWSTERAVCPVGTIFIKLDTGDQISGTLMIESMSRVRNGIAQFFLTEWDEQTFRCHIVMIEPSGTLRIEVWENPPDPFHICSPTVLA